MSSAVRPRCDGAGFRGSAEPEPWVSLTVAPAVRRLNVEWADHSIRDRASPGEWGKPIPIRRPIVRYECRRCTGGRAPANTLNKWRRSASRCRPPPPAVSAIGQRDRCVGQYLAGPRIMFMASSIVSSSTTRTMLRIAHLPVSDTRRLASRGPLRIGPHHPVANSGLGPLFIRRRLPQRWLRRDNPRTVGLLTPARDDLARTYVPLALLESSPAMPVMGGMPECG